jgi:phospholipase A2
MFRAKPGRGFLLATSVAYTATLTYTIKNRPRAKLQADSSASATADFDGKPTVITNIRRASQSGHVDDTGKQRAFVASSEQGSQKAPSQTKDHGAAYTDSANAAKSLIAIPTITSIFASFGKFDIAGLTESLTKAVVPAWVLALPNAIHKLQDELSMAPWSVSWEIWEQAHDPQVNPEIVWDARVRISNDLCTEEQQFLAKRRPIIAKALARYIGVPESEVHPDDVPVIAMCGSGGGLRAMVAGTSSYFSAQQAGLFDCATYTAGVSGSCWLQTLYYSSVGQTNYGRLIDHFKDRLGVHIAFPPAALSLLSQAPTNKFLLSGIVEKLKGVPDAEFGLVDVYGTLLASRLLIPKGELRVSDWDLKISNQRYFVDEGDQPLPIYAAVRHEIPITQNDRRESLPDAEPPVHKHDYFQWFEWTPYEFFCEELSAGIPTWAVGRNFDGGRNVVRENGLFLPEIKIPLMMVSYPSLSHTQHQLTPIRASGAPLSARRYHTITKRSDRSLWAAGFSVGWIRYFLAKTKT